MLNWKKVSGLLLALGSLSASAKAAASGAAMQIPRALDSYPDEEGSTLWQVLANRVHEDPFNLVATLIFFCAIIHTFMTSRFQHRAHVIEARYEESGEEMSDLLKFRVNVLHYLGEIEAVFGSWVLVLITAITYFKGWGTVSDYIGHHVNFTEPIFIVVIMAIAATRPILRLAGNCLRLLAGLGKHTVGAWWLTLLIVAPTIGSIITEPAAMTIAALLLGRQFFIYKPNAALSYATVGLLFVNISIGGTMTHFAAPPVLMVAGPWDWDTPFMFMTFGWKSLCAITVSTLLCFAIFRREFTRLQKNALEKNAEKPAPRRNPIPVWITVGQLCFLALSVHFAHYPALCVGCFLFFLGYTRATARHQGSMDLRQPMLVGFFLAGLVIHGGLQAWWIAPILGSLNELPLFFSTLVLSPVNDNAAITYLATLVPDLTDAHKYIVLSAAVTGGGLTVIANAPNPAGQSLLKQFFPDGIRPLGLFLGALPPTIVTATCFLLL